MDIHARLQKFLDNRGWTEYRLSKECGLTQTTIGNIFRRGVSPNLYTLERICDGFGITLAQFFADGEIVELTPELKEIFDSWVTLTPAQKEAALAMLKAMNHEE